MVYDVYSIATEKFLVGIAKENSSNIFFNLMLHSSSSLPESLIMVWLMVGWSFYPVFINGGLVLLTSSTWGEIYSTNACK